MSTIGKGTRRELALALRALKVARTHLGAARTGLTGEADLEVQRLMVRLFDELQGLAFIPKLATKRPDQKRRAA